MSSMVSKDDWLSCKQKQARKKWLPDHIVLRLCKGRVLEVCFCAAAVRAIHATAGFTVT
jgi:hypothetical protein